VTNFRNFDLEGRPGHSHPSQRSARSICAPAASTSARRPVLAATAQYSQCGRACRQVYKGPMRCAQSSSDRKVAAAPGPAFGMIGSASLRPKWAGRTIMATEGNSDAKRKAIEMLSNGK
jgi:hypothetical protein